MEDFKELQDRVKQRQEAEQVTSDAMLRTIADGWESLDFDERKEIYQLYDDIQTKRFPL